jgi:sugar O-acyltransferase (sialic acid O-acetyltransferase NeuD family)
MDIVELPVIVIGGGGHAKVLISTLLLCHRTILGFVELNPTASPLPGISYLGNDSAVVHHKPDSVRLVNGVGSTGSTVRRQEIYDRFTQKGYSFATVVHPSAIVACEVQIGNGAQIMAGAVLQPGTRVDSNAIVNTGAIIDHDCDVGAHAHIAPGAVLSGGVRVEAGAHIGTGACIIQGLSVGAGSLVGAGAVVTKNVAPGATIVGVPARPINKKLPLNPQ